jgi:GR25 family glycosyltransferase involved in LPS biosynthesis
MNANSYILSREGADLLLQKTSETGIDCALDNYMQRVFNQHNPNKVFHLNPLASFQLHEEGGNCEIDKNSDLRFSKEKF